MCIIIMKPSGVEMPSIKTLKKCWKNNSDGCGISITNNNIIYSHKGFMTFESFNDYLQKVGGIYELKDSAVMMHFRITSVGNTIPQQTHPFPIYRTVTRENLESLSFNSKLVFSHNGTMPITPNRDMSDTQTFAIDYLAQIYKVANDIFNTDTLLLIENIIKSKLCILKANGDFRLIGNFIEHDGVYYSNGTYEEFAYFNYSNTYQNSWLPTTDKSKKLKSIKNSLELIVRKGEVVDDNSKEMQSILDAEEMIYDTEISERVDKDLLSDTEQLLIKYYDIESGGNLFKI